jgi:hypothetical protein
VQNLFSRKAPGGSGALPPRKMRTYAVENLDFFRKIVFFFVGRSCFLGRMWLKYGHAGFLVDVSEVWRQCLACRQMHPAAAPLLFLEGRVSRPVVQDLKLRDS